MANGTKKICTVCEMASVSIPLHNVYILVKVNAFQYYQLYRNSYYFPLLYDCLEMFSYFAFVFLVSIVLLLWFCLALFLLFNKVIWEPVAQGMHVFLVLFHLYYKPLFFRILELSSH